MYPFEMNFDQEGFGYIDLSDNTFPLFKKQFLDLDYFTKEPVELKRDFYLLPSTDDYILKVNRDINNHDGSEYLMIRDLISLQPQISDIEFPIGYVQNGLNIVGQIIRHYKNAPSLKKICLMEDLEDLQKYIYLDDDSLHNLFLVYLEILKKLEYLYEHGLSYLDCHAGNWVITNNEVKLIDFESHLISFSKIRYYENCILRNYIRMINRVSSQFYLPLTFNFDDEYCFSKVKRKVLEFENNIRKNKR